MSFDINLDFDDDDFVPLPIVPENPHHFTPLFVEELARSVVTGKMKVLFSSEFDLSVFADGVEPEEEIL